MEHPEDQVVASYKIGTNKGRPRIWIDGKRLADAGFDGSTVYGCAVYFGKIVCEKTLPVDRDGLLHAHQRKVTGRPGGKPIIDLLGRDVEAAFPGAERVRATFEKGRITIEREE